jgi:hypothetical protein
VWGKRTWRQERVVWEAGGGGVEDSRATLGLGWPSSGQWCSRGRSRSTPRLARPCQQTLSGACRNKGAAVFSLSARGPGRGRCKVAPEHGVLCPDGERHAYSYRDPCARMWLGRCVALQEMV